MLSNWSGVLRHLHERYPALRHDAHAIRFDVPTASTPQPIVVLRSEVCGLPSATIVAMVCIESALLHRSALQLGSHLLAGALVLRDGVYLFRYTVPVAALTAASLDAAIALASSHATQIRASSHGASSPLLVNVEAFATAL